MKIEDLHNIQSMTEEFSKKERKAFLSALRAYEPDKTVHRSYGISMSGIWMTDVSIMDRRSVKAQLAGHGDYRAGWWKLNCTLHQFLKPHSTLEHRMHRFHSQHHALTFFYFQTLHEYRQIFQAIKSHGLIAGIRCAAIQVKHACKEQQ
jgi:hypothetical protein